MSYVCIRKIFIILSWGHIMWQINAMLYFISIWKFLINEIDIYFVIKFISFCSCLSPQKLLQLKIVVLNIMHLIETSPQLIVLLQKFSWQTYGKFHILLIFKAFCDVEFCQFIFFSDYWCLLIIYLFTLWYYLFAMLQFPFVVEWPSMSHKR